MALYIVICNERHRMKTGDCACTAPHGRSETYRYDRQGRLSAHTDRNGSTEYIHSNIDGSPVYRRAEDRKGRNPVIRQYAYYENGRLREALGGGTSYRYTYTRAGRLHTKTDRKGRRLLHYEYDTAGNVTKLTDPWGKDTAYTYDALGRISGITDGAGTMLAQYQYDGAGRVNRLRQGNGVETRYGYGDDGALSELTAVMPDGKVLLNLSYAYDGNGNCIEKSGPGRADRYAYDSRNRLTEASYDGRWERYTYDHAGNRLSKETAAGCERYTYNALNQLTSLTKPDGAQTLYAYDSRGNLLQERGGRNRSYAYDALGRLIEADTENAVCRYHYDGEGMRYRSERDGVPSYCFYDRGSLLWEGSHPGSGIRYTRGVDTVCSEQGEGNRHHHVRDELGSALFLLDEAHNITKACRYDAFGNLLEESGQAPNRLLYTGQEYDRETGQYYLRARYYSPETGRFTQEDTYRGDGLNLYAYCANNPVKYVDPTGHGIELYGVNKENTMYEGDGPGAWEKTNESMSAASKDYQKFVTGADEGMVYRVNGVKFDGYKDGMLIEAKGDYSNFVNKKTGEFFDWFSGKESLISQANRQMIAAGGTGIQWYFNDSTSMEAVKSLFSGQVYGIDFILKPMN